MGYKPRQQLLLFIIYAATFPSFDCQLLANSIPVDNKNFVCPGEAVTFTCKTRGSSIIAWQSEEYIEVGGTQLTFATFNNVGDRRISPANPDTVATLNRKDNVGGMDILVSTLSIVALEGVSVSSVTCVHVDSGAVNHTSFQVVAHPDMPQNLTSVLRNDTLTGMCMIHMSWNIPTNYDVAGIIYYMVHVNGENMVNETSSTEHNLMMAAHHVCTCDDHHVTVSAVNHCGREGQRAPPVMVVGENAKKLMMPSECPLGQRTGPGRLEECPVLNPCDKTVYIIVLVLLGIVCAGLLAGLIIALVCICRLKKELKCCQKIKPEGGKNDGNLSTGGKPPAGRKPPMAGEPPTGGEHPTSGESSMGGESTIGGESTMGGEPPKGGESPIGGESTMGGEPPKGGESPIGGESSTGGEQNESHAP